MNLFGGETNIFGLDIGTTGLRVAQFRGSSSPKTLVTYGAIAVDQRFSQSSAEADKKKLGEAIQKLLHDTNISTENVVLGIPSQKVFSTVVDLPSLSKQELPQSIKYQAEQYIPTSLDKVKLDWAVLGPSPSVQDSQEVLLVSAPNDYVESRLELVESIGLKVVAIEPDSVGLVRSLVPQDYQGACIILDMGAHSTDLVVVYGGAPRLIRSIGTGGETLIKSAAQNLNIDYKQAAQFVSKFGLTQNKLEGQVYKALQSSVDGLIEEINKSIKFFVQRYQQAQADKVIVAGGASRLPEFPLYIANSLSLPVEIGNAWTNVNYDPSLHDTLLSISSQFGVAAGLALREGSAL